MILSCVNINTLQRTAFLVDKKTAFCTQKQFFTVGSLMLIVKKRSFQSLYLTINLFHA